MDTSFGAFSKAVNEQFNFLQGFTLYLMDGDKDELYQHYLNSFPEQSNPVYLNSTKYDCSCCKQFIRQLGFVVSIVNGSVQSVWDIEPCDYPFDDVAKKMSEYVKKLAIKYSYVTSNDLYKHGQESTVQITETGSIKWHHLHGEVNKKFRMKPDYIGPHLSLLTAKAQVHERGLSEISKHAVDTVLDLIDNQSIYKWEEFKGSVMSFSSLRDNHESAVNKGVFVWSTMNEKGAGIRNSAIGELLLNIDNGDELDVAVSKYEAMVAPQNYRRTTSLITQGMVEQALANLDELGLRRALERRMAALEDVSVNDILYVSNAAQPQMKDALAELLAPVMKKPTVSIKNATDISIDDFVKNVLPMSQELKLLFQPNHLANLMALTAPVHADAGSLFQWDNNFAWSYAGNFTDAVKEKVKAAGGNVDAKLRVSLEWFNYDDLDIHCHSDAYGHVFYGKKKDILDVDKNRSDRDTREPVENLAFKTVPDGQYTIYVHNYSKRESVDIGFNLQVEMDGVITNYHYPNGLQHNEKIECLTINIQKGKIKSIVANKNFSQSAQNKTVWGLNTGGLIPVSLITISPNHWHSQQRGNKHYFFILEGCASPDPVRGCYNEFLRDELHPNRKVFEVLADKLKCPPTEKQLAGLGFSSTKTDTVTAILTKADSVRTYHIHFNQ